MEKEDSTEEQPVGSPATENVKEVDAPEGEDHGIDTPTNNELSNDEMVGTTTNTKEEGPERAPDRHEEEPSTAKHLVNNEFDRTAANVDNVDQEIETSSKRHSVDYVKDVDSEHSPETVMTNHQSEDETSMEMKSTDLSHSSCNEDDKKKGDDLNDQKGIILNSFPEETGDMKTNKVEEGPKAEANNAAWPGKAAAFTSFARVKSLYAVTNVFRRLSGKTGQNDSDEKDKDLNSKNKNAKEVNINSSNEREGQEVSRKPLEKPGWRSLSFIGITHDNELKEETHESLTLIAMKGRIVLYTRLRCQDCKQARVFLRKRRLRYSEINIDVYPSRKLELEKIAGSLDVPRVFFNEVLLGGLNELRALEESGKLEEKIEYVTTKGPSIKAPLPPFSGEDDVSSRSAVDELAVIVRKMKESIFIRGRFYKFRRVTNCFLGSEAVDFLSKDQYLEREEAIEFARKLSKELFFHHVLDENTFEDGNHLYRFLDQDPVISQCQNIPRGMIQLKRQNLVELSSRLRFLLDAILEAYVTEDGRHVDYRTIHGSEEFARYLRIAEELQRVDLNKTAKEERLAFFINLYNLMAIHAILVWGHPKGALDRRKVLNDFRYVIGGCSYSLSDIHNGILRSNQRPPYTLSRPFGISDKRFKVALPYLEPLIHFVLVSGNRSAPALRCYSPKNIDRELVEAARDFLRSGAFVFDLDSMTISVTQILKWYSVDFGNNEVEVLKHAANYLEPERTQTLLELLDGSQLKVVYQPYDWRLNC